MRTKLIRIIVLFQLLSMAATAPAETLVLLQGYLTDADYWRETGVTGVLAADGWVDAGTLHTTRSRIRTDRFRYTLETIVHTLLRAAPVPLVFLYIGWRLNQPGIDAAFEQAMGIAFVEISLILHFLLFLRTAAKPDGLIGPILDGNVLP